MTGILRIVIKAKAGLNTSLLCVVCVDSGSSELSAIDGAALLAAHPITR